MSRAPVKERGVRIPIRSEIALTAGKETLRNESYITYFFLRRGILDLDGGFRVGSDPERRQVTEVVITDRPPERAPGKPFRALTTAGDCLLIRDEEGELHDHRDCFRFQEARYVSDGVLFWDEHGASWLSEDEETAVQVLIDPDAFHPDSNLGEAFSEGPMQGSFVLTGNVPPRIGHVVWFYPYATGLSGEKRRESIERDNAYYRAFIPDQRALGPVCPDGAPDDPKPLNDEPNGGAALERGAPSAADEETPGL